MANMKETRRVCLELFLAITMEHVRMMCAPEPADVDVRDEFQILFANPLEAAVIRRRVVEHCTIDLSLGIETLRQFPTERRQLQPLSISRKNFPKLVCRNFACVEDAFAKRIHCLRGGDSFRMVLEKSNCFTNVSCRGEHRQSF